MRRKSLRGLADLFVESSRDVLVLHDDHSLRGVALVEDFLDDPLTPDHLWRANVEFHSHAKLLDGLQLLIAFVLVETGLVANLLVGVKKGEPRVDDRVDVFRLAEFFAGFELSRAALALSEVQHILVDAFLAEGVATSGCNGRDDIVQTNGAEHRDVVEGQLKVRQFIDIVRARTRFVVRTPGSSEKFSGRPESVMPNFFAQECT